MTKQRSPVHNATPDIERRTSQRALAALTETLDEGFREEMSGVNRGDPGAVVAVAVKLLNRLQVVEAPGRK